MIRTAEFVTPKHPDKLADRIADAILDTYMTIDQKARVAIEVLAGHGAIHIIGEATVRGISEKTAAECALDAVREFLRVENLQEPLIDVKIALQSPEIAQGVDTGGAGDQGIVYGMATRETEAAGEYLPLDYCLARSLCAFLYEKHPEDGKTQITIDGNRITTIVSSFANTKTAELEADIREWLIGTARKYGAEPAIPCAILANPAGDWTQSGWDADTGLTGRKLAVDNYGGACPCGGGAFSGKDPSKTDRSAAYMARHIALTLLLESSIEDENGKTIRPQIVQTKLAYAIGKAEPVDGTAMIAWENGKTTYSEIKDLELFKFDTTPNGIIEKLKLREIEYAKTSMWGAFGHLNKPDEFPWEKINDHD
jgi:S-adenosylmethionine synthetase